MSDPEKDITQEPNSVDGGNLWVLKQEHGLNQIAIHSEAARFVAHVTELLPGAAARMVHCRNLIDGPDSYSERHEEPLRAALAQLYAAKGGERKPSPSEQLDALYAMFAVGSSEIADLAAEGWANYALAKALSYAGKTLQYIAEALSEVTK